MARSKNQARQGKKKNDHTPKVAVAPPRTASKREKKSNQTKKALIQQEKAARKKRDQANRREVASLFGPLKTNRKANGKQNKQNNESPHRKQQQHKKNKTSPGRFNQNNNQNNNISILFDGSPIHARQRAGKRPNNTSRPRPSSQFQLKQIYNSKGCEIPWWTNDDRTQWLKKSRKELKQQQQQQQSPQSKRHYLFGNQPPHESWLSQLDTELVSFANYVQLSPSEQAARHFIVNSIETVSRTNLDCAKEKKSDEIRVHVFGSFATLPVCAYCSDVDLAIYGLVPPEQQPPHDNNSSSAQAKHTRFSETDNHQMAARVQKWKDLLEQQQQQHCDDKPEKKDDAWQSALDQLLDGANEGPDTPSKKKRSADRVVDLTRCSSPEDTKPAAKKEPEIINVDALPGNQETTKKSPVRMVSVDEIMPEKQPAVQNEETAKSPAKEEEPSQEALAGDFFVLDRVGIDEEEEEKKWKAKENNQNAEIEVANNKADDDVVGSKVHKTDEKQGNLKEAPTEETDATTTNRKRTFSEATNETNNNSGSDSEDDTADKLASLETRKHTSSSPAAAKRPAEEYRTEQAVISLSSDDEDDDDEEDDDLDDMQVSFVAHPTNNGKNTTIGPSGAVRAEVVNVLNSLGNILRRRQFTKSVTVIRKARVPIVKFQTKLGFEGDVAMGGHNGTDTSQFAMSQVQRFKSFATVVMALKIMLWQQGLDIPFHGGLGSYKLYVLVAHHLENHLELGGADRPGEVFLSFLHRYGQVKRGIGVLDNCHRRARTFLTQNAVLECCEGGYAADMSATYLLRHCIDLFRRCFMQVGQENVYTKAPKKGSSILKSLYDIDTLTAERSDSMEKAAMLDVFQRGQKKDGQQNRHPQQQNQRQNSNGGGGSRSEPKSKRSKA
ncbi:expressed unknown protein [Seminavis robusta]|uniref:Polymerase nucleotidyl transferase domain-containing protein n=1 Tax=Seminavis robusta TaxID=568900 RepID=A0A9N8F3H3_9STRA|nr:expressed unknown protein [Seminavis robusta]|eukprot:Sro2635_g333290.1 n/a (893) ;mRNA; f:977-3826